jgi:hypothetical protein
MQNDKSKFKNEFKRRLYQFALQLIDFLDRLPNELNEISKIFASSVLTLKGRK